MLDVAAATAVVLGVTLWLDWRATRERAAVTGLRARIDMLQQQQAANQQAHEALRTKVGDVDVRLRDVEETRR